MQNEVCALLINAYDFKLAISATDATKNKLSIFIF